MRKVIKTSRICVVCKKDLPLSSFDLDKYKNVISVCQDCLKISRAEFVKELQNYKAELIIELEEAEEIQDLNMIVRIKRKLSKVL